MAQARPRILALSETIQILLLSEPIGRALNMDSTCSLIGAVVICLAAVGLIELAVRGRKSWAREALGLLAILSLIFLLFQIVTSFWRGELQIPPLVTLWILTNFIAVGMLFTESAENWFASICPAEKCAE